MSAYFIKLLCVAAAAGIAASACAGTKYERIVCAVASCAVVLTFLSPLCGLISEGSALIEGAGTARSRSADDSVLGECEKLTEEMIYSHITEQFPDARVKSVSVSLKRDDGGEIIIESVKLTCAGSADGIKDYLELKTGSGVEVVSE